MPAPSMASTATRMRGPLAPMTRAVLVRILVRILAPVLALMPALAGCARTATVDEPAADASASPARTTAFTDSAGRRVELPGQITRIASANPSADAMLYAMAPDELVGWSSAPGDAASAYIDQRYVDLPEYGRLDGGSGDFSREALLASGGQVVVDVGQWDEERASQLDALQEELGIPVIVIDGSLSASGDAFRLLGRALGKTDLGDQMGAYADTILDDVRAKAAAIPQDRRPHVYYGEGEDGLSTTTAGSVHSQVFEMAGAALVADDAAVRAQRDGGTVSLEQVRAWNPDAIVLAPDSIGSTIEHDASWTALDAVTNGRCYTAPGEPYSWIDRPPGPNRLLGVQWLGSILHPETFDYDMVARTEEFYSLFYHHDLTDKEARALLNQQKPTPSPSPRG